jgi:hypothetical protein
MLIKYTSKYYAPQNSDGGMVLNNANWEYYALLYVDKELSQTERAIFESYTQQQPLLVAELDQLKKIVLNSDDCIIMPNKQNLLRPTVHKNNATEFYLRKLDGALNKQEAIALDQYLQANEADAAALHLLNHTVLDNKNNYIFNKALLQKPNTNIASNWSQLLAMYMDNELDSADRSYVEQQLVEQPALINELAALHNTQLVAENVPMPNKQILYKNANHSKVIPLWTRYAVAACSLAFVVTMLLLQKTGTRITTLKNNTTKSIVVDNTVNTVIKSEAVTNNDKPATENKIEKSNLLATAFGKATTYNIANLVKTQLHKNNNATVAISPDITNEFKLEKNTSNDLAKEYKNILLDDYDDAPQLIAIVNNDYKNITHLAYQTTLIDDNEEPETVPQTTLMNVPLQKLDKKGKVKKLAVKVQQFWNTKVKRSLATQNI